MDGIRFDLLTRRLSGSASRRHVSRGLGTLFGVALAPTLAGRTASVAASSNQGPSNPCKNTCDARRRVCRDECDALPDSDERKACDDSCDDTRKACRDVCEDCIKACDDDRKVCRDGCDALDGEPREECKQQCNADRKICRNSCLPLAEA